MTTATRFEPIKVSEKTIEDLQSVVLNTNAALYDAWVKGVRTQQQLNEAAIKFWVKAFSFPQQ